VLSLRWISTLQGHKHKKTALLGLGAAPLLVQLLDENSAVACTPDSAAHAADALSSLCHGCDDGGTAVTAAGGIAVLFRRLCDDTSQPRLLHACLRALSALAHTDSFVAELSRVPDIVPRLVMALAHKGNPVAVRRSRG
jgi:hypothetical protein